MPTADVYKCILPRMSYQYTQTPLFIIEALTDACILCGFEGIGLTENICEPFDKFDRVRVTHTLV